MDKKLDKSNFGRSPLCRQTGPDMSEGKPAELLEGAPWGAGPLPGSTGVQHVSVAVRPVPSAGVGPTARCFPDAGVCSPVDTDADPCSAEDGPPEDAQTASRGCTSPCSQLCTGSGFLPVCSVSVFHRLSWASVSWETACVRNHSEFTSRSQVVPCGRSHTRKHPLFAEAV